MTPSALGPTHSAAGAEPTPNTSRTPQYAFSAHRSEQEEQLKNNPLILRFSESRKEHAGDPHRPIYHLVSPEGMMNDAHGLSCWQGRWHLFYQGYPVDEHKRSHWAHAVSEDLVHWRDLPYALDSRAQELYPNQTYPTQASVERMRPEDSRPWELYDLSRDPAELNDLATESPEKVKELSAAFFAWQKQMPKPVPPPAAIKTETKQN